MLGFIDLLTPKDAAQAVLMGGVLICWNLIGKLAARYRAKKGEYAHKRELEEFRAEVTQRFDKMMTLRMFSEDRVMDKIPTGVGTLRVLLIEDDPNDRELMKRICPCVNFDLCPTLEAGLHLIERNGYDCVILDLGLPGVSDLEAVKSVCEEAPDMPVVVWTGNDSPNFPIEASKMGISAWLFKSAQLNRKDVVRAVRLAMARKKA